MTEQPRANAHDLPAWPARYVPEPRLAAARRALSGALTVTRLLQRDAEIRERLADHPEQAAAPFSLATVDGLRHALGACLAEVDGAIELLAEDPTMPWGHRP